MQKLECPNVDWFWLNQSTGERRAGRCRRMRCPVCCTSEAWWKSLIISHGGDRPPERFVTLTRAPEDWQRVRQKQRKLAHTLRHRHGYEWEWAWTVEHTKAGVPHVHCLQKGDYVPQALLQDLWGAIVDIRAIKQPSTVARYALKEACRVAGYTMKGATEDALAHLDRNGDRYVHLSRGYLGGHTQEAVRSLLLDEWRQDDPDEWLRVRMPA